MKKSIGISEISIFIPKEKIDIQEISRISKIDKDKLLGKIGVKVKPILSPVKNIISMAINAAKSLLKKGMINPADIDYILYCSTGLHDKYLWSPAAKVQQMIKAYNAFSFEINNGCNAGNLGINLATTLLKTNPEKNNVLVVVCDALSRVVNYENQDHKYLYNFSDAATAILVKRNSLKNKILAFSSGTLPEFVDHMSITHKQKFIKMNTDKDEDKRLSFAYKNMYILMINSAIQKAKLTLDKIDHLFINQGDQNLISYLSETLPISKRKIYLSYKTHGHMGGSDIFYGLDKMQKNGKIKPDEIIVLASSAVGFSWGATVIKC